MHTGMFYKGVSKSSVNIISSIFRKNGLGQNDNLAGGLEVVLNINTPFHEDVLPAQILPNTIIVENTTIEENQAALFAGASYIISYNSSLTTKENPNRVIFKSCRFLRNRSPIGAAFGVQSVFSGNVQK